MAEGLFACEWWKVSSIDKSIFCAVRCFQKTKRKKPWNVYVWGKACCNLSVLAPRATSLKIRAGLWESKPSSFMQNKARIFILFYFKKILGFDSAHKCSYLSTTNSLLLVMHHFSLNYHDMWQKHLVQACSIRGRSLQLTEGSFAGGGAFKSKEKSVAGALQPK